MPILYFMSSSYRSMFVGYDWNYSFLCFRIFALNKYCTTWSKLTSKSLRGRHLSWSSSSSLEMKTKVEALLKWKFKNVRNWILIKVFKHFGKRKWVSICFCNWFLFLFMFQNSFCSKIMCVCLCMLAYYFCHKVTMTVMKQVQSFIHHIWSMLNDELRQPYLYCNAQSKLDIIFSDEIISNFNAIKWSLGNNHSWAVRICGHFVTIYLH